MMTAKTGIPLLFFLITGTFSCVSSSKYEELQEKQNQTETALKEAEQKLSVQKKQLDQLQTDKRNLSENLKQASSRADKLTGENNNLKRQLGEARTNEQKLNSKISDLNAQLSKSKKTEQEALNAAESKSREPENIDRKTALRSAYGDLIRSFEDEIKTGEVSVQQLLAELRISIQQEILFPSGSVRLSDTGKDVLRKLAEKIKDSNFEIFIEGHTDSVGIGAPIRKRYPTNWDLGAARSIQVVRFLHEEMQVQPGRLGAGSYSWYRPVVEENSPEARAKNRRIEVVLVYREPLEEKSKEGTESQ